MNREDLEKAVVISLLRGTIKEISFILSGNHDKRCAYISFSKISVSGREVCVSYNKLSDIHSPFFNEMGSFNTLSEALDLVEAVGLFDVSFCEITFDGPSGLSPYVTVK